jgi:hypothetical protein
MPVLGDRTFRRITHRSRGGAKVLRETVGGSRAAWRHVPGWAA